MDWSQHDVSRNCRSEWIQLDRTRRESVFGPRWSVAPTVWAPQPQDRTRGRGWRTCRPHVWEVSPLKAAPNRYYEVPAAYGSTWNTRNVNPLARVGRVPKRKSSMAPTRRVGFCGQTFEHAGLTRTALRPRGVHRSTGQSWPPVTT